MHLEGGLLSSTINADRSLGVDGKIVGVSDTTGASSCKGGFFPSGGLLCVVSRKRESDNGDGAVRSIEDAAQSQCVGNAP